MRKDECGKSGMTWKAGKSGGPGETALRIVNGVEMVQALPDTLSNCPAALIEQLPGGTVYTEARAPEGRGHPGWLQLIHAVNALGKYFSAPEFPAPWPGTISVEEYPDFRVVFYASKPIVCIRAKTPRGRAAMQTLADTLSKKEDQ